MKRNPFLYFNTAIVCIVTLSACTNQTVKSASKPKMTQYEQEMLGVGNTHCRFLAARLAKKENDREFGGYDPSKILQIGGRLMHGLKSVGPY